MKNAPAIRLTQAEKNTYIMDYDQLCSELTRISAKVAKKKRNQYSKAKGE